MTTSGSPEPGNYDPQSYGSAGAPAGQTPGSYPPPPAPADYSAPGGYSAPGNYSAPPSPGGYGQPGYGQPGHYAATPGYPAGSVGARPGVVTGAAVMAFVIGGFQLLGGLLALFGGGFLVGTGLGGIVIFIGLLLIALGALHIWAGKLALDGKDFRVLLVVAAISAVFSLIQLFSNFSFGNLLGLAIPVVIIVLLLRPEAKAWIKTRGGQTF